jgi:hypothetical protein
MSDAADNFIDDDEGENYEERMIGKMNKSLEILLSPVSNMSRKWDFGRQYAKESATIAIEKRRRNGKKRTFLVAFWNQNDGLVYYYLVKTGPQDHYQEHPTLLGNDFSDAYGEIEKHDDDILWVSAGDVMKYQASELRAFLRGAKQARGYDWRPDRYEFNLEKFVHALTSHYPTRTDKGYIDRMFDFIVESMMTASLLSRRLHVDRPEWVGTNAADRYMHNGFFAPITHESVSAYVELPQPSVVARRHYVVSYSAISKQIVYRRFDMTQQGVRVTVHVFQSREEMHGELLHVLRSGGSIIIDRLDRSSVRDYEDLLSICSYQTKDEKKLILNYDYGSRKIAHYKPYFEDMKIGDKSELDMVEDENTMPGHHEIESAENLLFTVLVAPCIPNPDGTLTNIPGLIIHMSPELTLEIQSIRIPGTNVERYHQFVREFPGKIEVFESRQAMVRNIRQMVHQTDATGFFWPLLFDAEPHGPMPAAAIKLLKDASHALQIVLHQLAPTKRYMYQNNLWNKKYRKGVVDILNARDVDML